MATAVDSQIQQHLGKHGRILFEGRSGYYTVTVATFGGGNVELQVLGPDQSTYLSAPAALKLSAAGTIAGYLPPGQYKFVITTATAVYCDVTGVPIS